MKYMFKGMATRTTTFDIGDLSNWDTSKVTNMRNMFQMTGQNSTTWNSIGNLKVYANNISMMFYNCPKAKATLSIYSNPSSTSQYDRVFSGAATASGSLITVNYSNDTTNINNIVSTRSSNSNVVKGEILS